MAKRSRKKLSRPRGRQKRSAFGFGLVMTALVVLGVAGIALSRSSRDETPGGGKVGPKIGQHWHAAFGINVCGQWKPNVPQYESPLGIHSHGDGFMHIHPFSRAGAGTNATVGMFLKGAGESVTAHSMKLVDGTKLSNGDECPPLGNKSGEVRWSVNGEEKKGDPAKYVPRDTDVIAVAFLPKGQQIGTPPVAPAPTDVAPPPASTPDTAPGTTATTAKP